MANVSDVIESFLLQLMGEEAKVNINRNELADYFSVAPSQINYVLTTRFNTDKGYIVESKRGGGGFVTVIRVRATPYDLLNKLINLPLNTGITQAKAYDVVDNLVLNKILTEREGLILKNSLSDKALVAPSLAKDGLRAGILRQVARGILATENA